MWDYRSILGWQKGHALALEVYRITGSFPVDERFGLVTQLRRAATAVPANVAEGAGRSSTKDFARFLSISIGSANEVAYLLLLSLELGYLDESTHAEAAALTDDTRRLIMAYRKRLTRS